jgi:hypothetical protein
MKPNTARSKNNGEKTIATGITAASRNKKPITIDDLIKTRGHNHTNEYVIIYAPVEIPMQIRPIRIIDHLSISPASGWNEADSHGFARKKSTAVTAKFK